MSKVQHALALAIMVLLVLSGVSLLTVAAVAGIDAYDFMQFYFAGQIVNAGKIDQIYDREEYAVLLDEVRSQGAAVSPNEGYYWNRPPLFALLYTGLATLPYHTASTLFVAINVLICVTLVWKLPSLCLLNSQERTLARICLLLFVPFLAAISSGHDTLLLTAVVAAAVSFVRRGKDVQAGILLSLCLFKPHSIWAIPLGLWVSGRRRAVTWFLGSAFLLAIASCLLVGKGGLEQWMVLLTSPSTDYRPDLMRNIRGVWLSVGATPAIAVGVLSVGATTFLFLHGSQDNKIAAAIIASLLLSPHTYIYDMSLLAVVAFVVPSRLCRQAILLPWPYVFGSTGLQFWPILCVGLLVALSVAPLRAYLQIGGRLRDGKGELQRRQPERVDGIARATAPVRGTAKS